MTESQTHDCPWCGLTNPETEGEDANDALRPGDVAVCWGCVHLSVFTGKSMRRPTLTEQRYLAEDPMVQPAMLVVTQILSKAAESVPKGA